MTGKPVDKGKRGINHQASVGEFYPLAGIAVGLSRRQRKRRERQLKYLFAGLLGAGVVSLSLAPAQAQAVRQLSALNGSDGFRLDGAAASDSSGRSVSGAGDVNGDGFADLIVGAYNTNHRGSDSGSAYVVFGTPSGSPASLNLSSLDGSNGFRLDGPLPDDYTGISVSGAGDVNGDDFDDLIIGASGAEPNGNSSGSTYVIFGAASFPAAVKLDFFFLNGVTGLRLDGPAANDLSGTSVSGAGDVNGDTFDDLIIGAPFSDSNGSGSGSSYVIFGKAAGFPAALNLSTLNGTDGFRLDGEDEGDYAGQSVSGAGDVNGDTFDDLIIGAYEADPNGAGSGSSYVVFGKADWSATTESLNLSSLNGTNGFRLDGAAEDDSSGSVSGAGDVNDDGLADLIISAPGADPNANFSGSSYVVFGKEDWSATTKSLNLSSLDGANGFRLDGTGNYDFSGRSVSGAEDFNGDGFDDLIIGAPGAGPNSGSSYVVFGKADWSATTISLNLSTLNGTNGFRLDGTDADDHAGRSVSGAGDVNQDGLADLIIGADKAGPNDDNAGSSYVVFGRGPARVNGNLWKQYR